MPYNRIIQLSQYVETSVAIELFKPLGNVACLSGKWGQIGKGDHLDFITAAPSVKVKEHNQQLIIEEHGISSILPHQKAFNWLECRLSEAQIPASLGKPDIPTIFGFIGYISYDYRHAAEVHSHASNTEKLIPDINGGIYHWNLINNHHQKTSYLAFDISCSDEFIDNIKSLIQSDHLEPTKFKLLSNFISNTHYIDYQKAFDQIKDYIIQGDCYQVNYTHRHQAHYTGTPSHAYNALSKQIKTPFSAYLEFDDYHILSLSPERFIKVDGNNVETNPIKGTRARGTNESEDTEQINALQNSSKDRAENLMIVDLLRNDLNRTCLIGSVKVPSLFKVESYPNVHHLVSTVVGQKPAGTSILEVLKQAFPGGSITGAPKIRSMEIIDELETFSRSIYCGSIFYAGFDGNMDSNICIRTLLCKDNSIYCWGGGGIVADSICEDEYQESITKIKNLMDELERMSGLEVRS